MSGYKKRSDSDGKRFDDRTIDIRTLIPDDNETDDLKDDAPF